MSVGQQQNKCLNLVVPFMDSFLNQALYFLVCILHHLGSVNVFSVVFQGRFRDQLFLTDGAVKLEGGVLHLLAVEGCDLLGGRVDSPPVILKRCIMLS